MKVKIGLAQLNVAENKEENIKNAEQAIAQLAEQQGDIIVLPEMFNTPYQAKNFPIYAEEKGGETFTRISQAAKKNNVNVIAGSSPVEENGKIYNASYLFDREGMLLGEHRKAHLFDIDVKGGQRFMESETLTPGDCSTVVEMDGIKVGVCVCYDFRFPELSRRMTLDGAKIIVVPGAFNMTTGPAHWELLFRQRAVDNQLYTVGVAPARDEEGVYVSYANSMVCSPWGDIVSRLGTKQELAVVEIELDKIQEIRDQLPLLKHRREELY